MGCTPSCASLMDFFTASNGTEPTELVTGIVGDLVTGNWPGVALKLTGLAALLLGGGKATQVGLRHVRAVRAANKLIKPPGGLPAPPERPVASG